MEADPFGRLHLWAREHYKSTIITFAQSIQNVLSSHGEDPDPFWEGREVTIGIFSCTRPIAKAFLRQIRIELESNEFLKDLFPDVLWENPKRDAPKWSEDDGLIVKRKSNPKESTIEAWGLVDGQPTSKHFFVLNYDDIVTLESVRSTNMIAKTTEALEMSYNLGTDGGYKRFAGTRYRFNDSYNPLIARGTPVSVWPCYPVDDEGNQIGPPYLQSEKYLEDKRRDMGPYVFACQMLLNPKADDVQGFKEEWMRHYKPYETDVHGNIYILIDPANEKKKHNDYTAGWVVEACSDEKYRVREILRDRLSLTERADWLFDMHRKYTRLGHKPLRVGYEKYGMQADIEHIKDRQKREGYEFPVTALGGQLAKHDRIRKLIPLFKNEQILLPTEYFRVNYEGKREDLVQVFIDEEYSPFPVMAHDDMLDGLARLQDPDMHITFPMPDGPENTDFDTYDVPLGGGGEFVF